MLSYASRAWHHAVGPTLTRTLGPRRELSLKKCMEVESFHSSLQPYFQSFAECEPGRRLELLAQAMEPSAEIWGPKVVFRGYEDISAKISAFQRNWPQCRLLLASGIVSFQNAGHFAMVIANASGQVLASGYSVVELAPSGRIQRVLAFWGEPCAVPQGWPEHLVLAQTLRSSAGA